MLGISAPGGSSGPASSSRTFHSGRSLSLDATTAPAVPPKREEEINSVKSSDFSIEIYLPSLKYADENRIHDFKREDELFPLKSPTHEDFYRFLYQRSCVVDRVVINYNFVVYRDM